MKFGLKLYYIIKFDTHFLFYNVSLYRHPKFCIYNHKTKKYAITQNENGVI